MYLNDHELDLLTNDLKRHEGVSLFCYRCPTGHMTIGYGRNIDREGGKGITKEEAEYLLDNDVADFVKKVETSLPWSVSETPKRKRVLVNMAFNLGINGLLGFVMMLNAMQSGDYKKAAAEMMNSKWARQVGSRAVELAVDMEHG